MTSIFKSGNSRLYISLIVLLSLAGLWRLTQAVNQKIIQVPIKQAPRTVATNPSKGTKDMYPVWVLQSSAVKLDTSDASVEGLFGAATPEVAKPEPVKETAVETFQKSLRITGFGYQGVFARGLFFKAGEPMSELAFTDDSGKLVIPVLVSSSNNIATFDIGGKRLIVKDRYGVQSANF